MAAFAGVRCVGVARSVALVTVHVRVRTRQRPTRRGGMVEAARCPAVSRVALCTVRSELRLRVVGLHGGRIVRHVARVAVGRGAGEAVGMALHAVHRGVLAREWEVGQVMIKCRIGPRAFVVALGAVRGQTRRHVIRIRGGGVFRQVAALAGVGGVGVGALMTLIATDRNMSAEQRPNFMVECCWAPSRVGRVAGGTIRGEAGHLMVRIACGVEILLMARGTFRRCIGEVPGRMALRTVLYGMAHRQRKEVMYHIRSVPASAHGVVAFDTIGRKASFDVIRRLGGCEIALVATETIIAHSFELQRVSCGMTIHTCQVPMRAHQCETILLM